MKNFLLIASLIFSGGALAESYLCTGKAVFVKSENGKEVKRGDVLIDKTFEITHSRGDSFAKFRDGTNSKKIKVSEQDSLIIADDKDGSASKYIHTKFTLDLNTGDADIYSEAKRGQTMWIRHMVGTCN